MSFYAKNFIFAGESSDLYGIRISSTNDGEDSSSPANANVELITQKIFRRPAPFFLGSTLSPVLEFSVEFTATEGELTQADMGLASKWLFGRSSYENLIIIQQDMEDVRFKCFFTNPEIKRVGNIIIGFTATVTCDSPFAYGNTKTTTFTQSNKTYTLFNESENLFYTYPRIEIQMNGVGSSVQIKNVTDNNRTMTISNLLAGELITIDNDLQIITSSSGDNILNKIASPIQFFRLLNGVNNIFILGNIIYVKVIYTPYKRMA
jgi:hypothetical protein